MTHVIKIGGNEMDAPGFLAELARLVAALTAVPERTVIVHGGGKEIAELQTRLGVRPVMVDGLRVTDAASLKIAEMVLSGCINKAIVRELLAAGVDAVGLSGVDGGLLRYPLEFIRITSAFSQSRFHPILKRNRPHLGVDFAAPAGTPVRAVGNGAVRWAGMQGGYGRHVELDHGGGLVSAYSHLRGINKAVRVGSRVRRGQVIGWVGQSGLATGPHLHFAIFDRGEYVNPLKFHGMAMMTRVDRREFERVRATLTQQLRILAGSDRAVPSRPPLVLSSLAQPKRLGPVTFTF